MLPSVDAYLYREIYDKLKIIMSNRYIIEEILKGMEIPSKVENNDCDKSKTVRNFIRTYGGDNGVEIPITYTLPQERVLQEGQGTSIYIGLREGEENSNSLGNVEGSYSFKEEGITKERATIKYSESRHALFFDLSYEIGELVNVEGIAFSERDNVSVEGNRVYFLYDPMLDPKLVDHEDLITFNVNYIPNKGRVDEEGNIQEEQGLKKGFSATESYSIIVLSTNMDTVRCLDLIIKSILIMMRDNPQEQNNTLLQKLQFGQIDEIDIRNESNDGVPMLLYGRETIITYTTSYSLDVALEAKLKEIIVNMETKEEGS